MLTCTQASSTCAKRIDVITRGCAETEESLLLSFAQSNSGLNHHCKSVVIMVHLRRYVTVVVTVALLVKLTCVELLYLLCALVLLFLFVTVMLNSCANCVGMLQCC